ncbi:energy transducer TonB [Paraburkholderia kururiensis]|uniref:Energy transducer TonB n=1 Tax=Paraburkholderia kururiensis TaxID=984307 RepID=A0ABZ0WM29_9BURK|nr:energy transducer TonB [Paraburkholderia kururiensis]WQD78427.1 energy transducer TonB [Paraburkholderia kururiensis]
MSAALLSSGGDALHARRFAVYRALLADAGRGAAREVRVFAADEVREKAYEARPVSARGVVRCALAVTLLHVALIAAWRHAGPAAPAPVVTPPIALQMDAPPKALPQAPKASPTPPVTPPKPLPQRAHAHPARPRPAPAPSLAPTPVAAPPQSTPTPAPVTAPVQTPAPAAPEKTTLPDGNADYLHNPAPDYPPTAQDYGWQGKVVLHVHVRADGSPDTIEIRRSSGHRVLDEAGIAAVRHWSFVPAKRGATPIDGWVDVPLNFQLD